MRCKRSSPSICDLKICGIIDVGRKVDGRKPWEFWKRRESTSCVTIALCCAILVHKTERNPCHFCDKKLQFAALRVHGMKFKSKTDCSLFFLRPGLWIYRAGALIESLISQNRIVGNQNRQLFLHWVCLVIRTNIMLIMLNQFCEYMCNIVLRETIVNVATSFTNTSLYGNIMKLSWNANDCPHGTWYHFPRFDGTFIELCHQTPMLLPHDIGHGEAIKLFRDLRRSQGASVRVASEVKRWPCGSRDQGLFTVSYNTFSVFRQVVYDIQAGRVLSGTLIDSTLNDRLLTVNALSSADISSYTSTFKSIVHKKQTKRSNSTDGQITAQP